jgi:hypothetical protein
MAKSRFTGFKAEKVIKSMSGSSGEDGGNSFSNDIWTSGLEKDQDEAEFIIRFLPSISEDTDVHYVDRPMHMITFPSSGKKIFEPCPRASNIESKWLDEDHQCPICEVLAPFWKLSKEDPKRKMASDRYAKPQYYSNIYVVKDPRNNGENEGKIKIFRYGKKIHTKCLRSMERDADDEESKAIVYFDPLSGADFKIIVRKVDEFINYDDSKFIRLGKPLRLVDGTEMDEDNLDAFMEGAFDLVKKFKTPEHFKSYSELKEIYENQGYAEGSSKSKKDDDDEDEDTVVKKFETSKKAPVTASKPSKPKDEDDEDDDEVVVKKVDTAKKVQNRNPETAKPKAVEKEVDDEDYAMDNSDDDEDDLASLLADDDE